MAPDTAPAPLGRGRLIAIEGIDAAGKSTQAGLLADYLGAMATYQFGATAVGAQVRKMLLGDTDVDHRAEALLIAADKAQHLAEIVEPALAAGRDVVSDRFTASAVAYQGYGHGIDIEALDGLLQFATSGAEPDLYLLLDIDPLLAKERLGPGTDRYENAGVVFAERVRNGYLQIAAADPDRWEVIDASPPRPLVHQRLAAVVERRLR